MYFGQAARGLSALDLGVPDESFAVEIIPEAGHGVVCK
jgi:hypothetical protein